MNCNLVTVLIYNQLIPLLKIFYNPTNKTIKNLRRKSNRRIRLDLNLFSKKSEINKYKINSTTLYRT